MAAILCLATALFGPVQLSLIAFPLCGFRLSVMFSIIFSLGPNSTLKHHDALSGILCSGILGGAIGEDTGLRVGLLLVFGLLTFMMSISFWARPLVKNATLFDKTA